MSESQHVARVRSCFEVGDLFAEDHPVITVKTGGRAYGALSRQAVARGIPIPVIEQLGQAVVQVHEGKTMIFVALWEDESPYDDRLVYACTTAAIRAAHEAGLESVSLPLVGASEALRLVGSMGRAIIELEELFERQGWDFPDVRVITDKTAAL